MKRPALLSLLAVGLIVATLVVARSDLVGTRRQQDCADLEALLDAEQISVPSRKIEIKNASKQRRNTSLDGIVKRRSALDNRMPFSIRRAHVMTRWLIRPTRAVPGPKEPDVLERVDLPVGDTLLPVTFAKETHIGNEGFVAYFYALGREPLSSPFWARIRTAPEAFVSGLRPITLFVVTGAAHRTRLPEERQRALDWIAASWEHYLLACHPPAGSQESGSQEPGSQEH